VHDQPQPWERFPRAMLRARAIAEAVRIACPEVLHGAIYTPEELGAVVDQEGNPVITVERADGPPVEQAATVVQSTPNGPPQTERRDYLAEALAETDAERRAAIMDAARESGAPEPYLAALDNLRQAHEAETVEDVRRLYEALKANGENAEQLARIAHIGSSKPGAKAPQQDDRPAAEGSAATPAADAERAAVAAEERLRITASRANLPSLDADFERVYGLPIAQATAAQLDTFRQKIEAAGSAQ
jgi:hypothetical protein